MSKCHPFGNNCVEFDDYRKDISIADNKSRGGCKFKAKNPDQKHVVCLNVDGCLISDNNIKKCDFLLLICKDKRAVFIELKGQNLHHAADQLNSSIKTLYPQLQRHGNYTLMANIVKTKNSGPDFKSSVNYKNLIKTIQKYGGDYADFTENKIQSI